MTTINQTKLTAQKFLMLGEDPPGVRLELVHGEIAVSPSPSYPHSHAIIQLSIILGSYINQQDLGSLLVDIDTILDQFNVRRPDLLFVAKSRLHLIKGHGIPLAPDLCIEVVSPSSVHIDRDDKFALYRDRGVPNYWMINPIDHAFEAYQLKNGHYVQAATGREDEVVHAPPFESLAIPLSKLWTPIGTP
ncbi:MAG TPA: Uma2 family endonuclease [Phycisphaerae bacterium]|nr:Uma2 family endonuclease [Phycisphaerae bacterium]